MNVLVAGAGGFIGGHLVKRLVSEGHQVRAVDVKPLDQWFQSSSEVENWPHFDLAVSRNAIAACAGMTEVYDFAADMGGMGFIENNKAACMLSVLTGTHLLLGAAEAGCAKFFFASSACVYPGFRQSEADVTALREDDAYPAMPEDGYGWEKLFTERMCNHFREDFGLETRIGRFHNIYGPRGTWHGGREKAPAALCRKVIEAKRSGVHEVEVWGDGQQTRSFTYITDGLEGTKRLMASDYTGPLNIGSSQLVTVDELLKIIEGIAGIQVTRRYELAAPVGVRGRNSDNKRIREILDWEPSISLKVGLEETYRSIYDEMASLGSRVVRL